MLGTLQYIPLSDSEIMYLLVIFEGADIISWCFLITVKLHENSSVSSTPKDFQTVYEGEILCLCTVTFGQNGPKLNSSPVYCLQL